MSRPLAIWTRSGKGGDPLRTVEMYAAGDEPAGYHAERSDGGGTVMVRRLVGSGPIAPPKAAPPAADGLPPVGTDFATWRRARRQGRREARAGSTPREGRS